MWIAPIYKHSNFPQKIWHQKLCIMQTMWHWHTVNNWNTLQCTAPMYLLMRFFHLYVRIALISPHRLTGRKTPTYFMWSFHLYFHINQPLHQRHSLFRKDHHFYFLCVFLILPLMGQGFWGAASCSLRRPLTWWRLAAFACIGLRTCQQHLAGPPRKTHQCLSWEFGIWLILFSF